MLLGLNVVFWCLIVVVLGGTQIEHGYITNTDESISQPSMVFTGMPM